VRLMFVHCVLFFKISSLKGRLPGDAVALD